MWPHRHDLDFNSLEAEEQSELEVRMNAMFSGTELGAVTATGESKTKEHLKLGSRFGSATGRHWKREPL